MKRIICTITLIISFLIAQAQRSAYAPGWITINLNDFMCNKATADDPLNFDGFGDEVYFVIFYAVADQYGVTKYSNKLVSKTYGDTYRFPDRVVAGSANSNKGGILTGNQFFPGTEFPNLKKIRVEAGDFITVITTIWEWDNGSSSQLQSSFESRVMNSFNVINLKMVDFIRDCHGYYSCYQINNRSAINFPAVADLLSPMINGVGSRPIGMSATGEFTPVIFGLNSDMIKSQDRSASSNGINYSMNYISFDINEESLGNTNGHGIYRLRYHFSFEEDKFKPAPPPPSNPPTPTTVAPPAPVKLINTVKKDLPVKNINSSIAVTLTGNWAGIQTNDYGLYPQNIVFELTGNGEFLIKDNNGLLAAKGAYTFSNNIINCTYKQLSSGETFSFIGTYDTNTQKLTCTLGNGTATTGQGKWIATKK